MKVLKRIVAGLLVFLLVLILWGFIEPYIYDVEEHAVAVPGLPAAWEGQRVAQISDWQIGMWLDNSPTVRDVVRRVVEEQPALVLITGDFVYHPVKSTERVMREVIEIARPLMEAGLPVYAVLGNHDYGTASEEEEPNIHLADRVAQALQETGIRVLRNESVPLPAPGVQPHAGPGAAESLYLVGIGPEWPDRARAEHALAGVPSRAPRLVMMHNPNTFEHIPPHAAPLAVAGHTHGGQVRLPFLPQWSFLTLVRPGYTTTDGWIRTYNVPGNRLYVNRGIGMGVVPLRINCLPELTFFTLHAGPPRG